MVEQPILNQQAIECVQKIIRLKKAMKKDELALESLESELIGLLGLDVTVDVDGIKIVISRDTKATFDADLCQSSYPSKVRKARLDASKNMGLTRAIMAPYLTGAELDAVCIQKPCKPTVQVRLK